MFKVKKLNGHDDIDILKTCTSIIGRPFMKAYFMRVDNVFIDTGNSGCSARALKGYLRDLEKRDDWLILNTHLHEDHCGNNGRIQDFQSADILVPRKIDISGEMSLFYRIFWGIPGRFKSSVLEDEIIVTDAGRKIKVIRSPGHTKCHRCYFIEDDNILITGDAIPFPARKVHCLPGEDYLQSIETMKGFKDFIDNSTIFFTAHQGVLSDPGASVRKRIENMESVADEVKKAWETAQCSIEKTAGTVFGEPGLLDRLIAPRMSHENTVRSIIGNYERA